VALIHKSARRRTFLSVVATVVVASLSWGFFLVDQAAGSSTGPDVSSSSCTSNTCNSNYLTSVSCVGSKFCMAVGAYRTSSYATIETLIEQKSGSTWTLVHSPNPSSGQNQLESVSCVTKRFCIAVGQNLIEGHGWRKITEAWNGKSWKIVDAWPTTFARLQGVSCLSSRYCTAVGYYAIGKGPTSTLIEQWDGRKWSIVPSPNFAVTDAFINELNAVTCLAATDCFAVGEFALMNNRQFAGIERWNGTLWKVVSSPSPGTGNLTLASVSCANAHMCFADGDYNNDSFSSSGYHSLIEKWNGSTWGVVADPKAPLPDDSLNSVSCATTKLCFATGLDGLDSGGHSIIDSWRGSTWTNVKPPLSTTPVNISLSGVTCVTSSSCYAVGSYPNDDGHGPLLSLIEHWDDSLWSAVSAPNYFG
jgi:hypothetical protein